MDRGGPVTYTGALMPKARWLIPTPEATGPSAFLARELNLPPAIAGLLSQRGLADLPAAQAFLDPKLSGLSDPFLLPDMDPAVDRILAALDAGERIVLYGDYDVDGVTSLAILSELLTAYGAQPACFLPSRLEEGYGLSEEGLARCVQTLRPELLLAVDCGTASVREIASLQSAGVDVIVLDHHEPGAERPRCRALVNPKLGEAFRYLCSAGLAFKLCHALLKRRPLAGFDLRLSLDLVALGTVADLVPLTAENRILVRRGTVELGRTRRPGLRALLEVAGVSAPVRPVDIGFRLAPRLNAAGRLGTAQAALELLMTGDAPRAAELAALLDTQNRERQLVEERTLQEAQKQLQAFGGAGGSAGQAAIVVGARGWHPGVLGIVAARLMRAHHRPVFVIGFDERGVGKGSGRSIEGLSLVGALADCAPWLDRFGGHEMAAGLTLQESAFAEFQQRFCAIARGLLDDEQLRPRLRLDAEIRLAELGESFLAGHERLQPFGMGNPQPVFLASGVVPVADPLVMKGKHLRLVLRQPRGTGGAWGPATPAVYFQGALEPLPAPPWDIAFQVEADAYRGETRCQVRVQAVREAAA
jgi:single-stranded-DNA-specific exonuclease